MPEAKRCPSQDTLIVQLLSTTEYVYFHIRQTTTTFKNCTTTYLYLLRLYKLYLNSHTYKHSHPYIQLYKHTNIKCLVQVFSRRSCAIYDVSYVVVVAVVVVATTFQVLVDCKNQQQQQQ